MTLSRRRFLGGSATIAATAAAAVTAQAVLSEPDAAFAACEVLPTVSPEIVAMNRLSYGPSPQDQAAFRQANKTADQRYTEWVDKQLNPTAIADTDCDQRLTAARLKIKYDAVNQARPLSLLGANIGQLWPLADDSGVAWDERQRPYNEVRVASWIRGVYSKRQLLEVMVDFWHNHFNVKATSDQHIAATWPLYDRDVIRTHALGNFRSFTEAVGKSVAMMYYLDNISNRAGGGEGGNENYARELIELHTLGSDNYLKFYDDRGKIETVKYGNETFPIGYIDDDVYEASRCFTGWTIGNGWDKRPDNGAFFYKADWHDTYPKTVLAPRMLPNVAPAPNIVARQADLADGKQVYDLVCYHPGTARHICTKLCRRLISDNPPKAVIDAAVAVWMANRRDPFQIAKVLRTILLSAECKATYGRKVKRPLESIWAYLRATNAQLPVDVESVDGDAGAGGYWNSIFWQTDLSGHRLFGWDTPTGHPDKADYWANTNGMLMRWNLFYNLTQTWGGNVGVDIIGQTPMTASCTQIVDFWAARLCGFPLSGSVQTALVNFLAQGGSISAPPQPLKGAPDYGAAEAVQDRVRAMVQLMAMSPDFNLR